ncbi:lysine-specific demethylase 9 [Drosophila gunungcola]|uniref:Uncharacterized protein n=1 Tax=Drosophila gunungcola TaxID=103775 RepID=A0A9P9YQN6_9MUSC|nr:lysine-specific demethylase 9 [Drosophila gunungcola]KAI8040859.1 hypothetical protein M5D96_006802 [Drosophila gunungcola]
MKSVIILLALVAFCQAAPLDVKESSSEALSRPSPISPDVISDPKPPAKVVLLKDAPVLNREKRNEPKKPDNAKAHEAPQHNNDDEKPIPLISKPQESHHEDHHSKHRREAHHEEGHKEDKEEDLPASLVLPTDAHTAELPKKQEKRETVEKPASVKARESIQHNPQHSEDLQKAIESLTAGKATEQRHQRDIPVPTQTKATAEPAAAPAKSEAESTTPSSVHHLNIPHPIPVAELFEKNRHSEKTSSSSEESKESKEKVKA